MPGRTDGFSGYEIVDTSPEITPYACMAHARRYFHNCKDTDPEETDYVLSELRTLDMIERGLRTKGADADERRTVRRETAKPILDALEAWLGRTAGLPKRNWGKAVRSSLGRWNKLTRYVDDGQVEIDTTLVEHAIRPLALGRKNSLFAGSHAAAQRSAILYWGPVHCRASIPRHGSPMFWRAFRRIRPVECMSCCRITGNRRRR